MPSDTRRKQIMLYVFYAYNGPGPWPCDVCGKDVVNWWLNDGEYKDITNRDGLAVHHRDGDHENNTPSNLGPTHFGCHISRHKLANPIVPRGSKLPPEWREKIAIANRHHVAKRDLSPIMCHCGSGPYKGMQGLSIHQGRMKHV